MRRSLIIILIVTLFLEGIGGFLDSRGSSCNAAIFSNTIFASLFSNFEEHDHDDPGENRNGESHEIVEMPSEDDYCHRPNTDLKAVITYNQGKESYSDFYVSHYPWTPKEIHTPPPKA